jgi:hypothetical protein
LGEYINKVKYIITELTLRPSRQGQICFDAVEEFLKGKGFKLLDTMDDGNPDYCNALFANKKDI